MCLGRDQVIAIGWTLNRRHSLGAAADGANRVSQRRATTAGSTASAKGTGLRILLHAQPGQLCTPGLRRQRWAFGGRRGQIQVWSWSSGHADFNRTNSGRDRSSSYGDISGIEMMPEQNAVACRLT